MADGKRREGVKKEKLTSRNDANDTMLPVEPLLYPNRIKLGATTNTTRAVFKRFPRRPRNSVLAPMIVCVYFCPPDFVVIKSLVLSKVFTQKWQNKGVKEMKGRLGIAESGFLNRSTAYSFVSWHLVT